MESAYELFIFTSSEASKHERASLQASESFDE